MKPFVSVAVTVKEKVPVAVGVPERTPAAESVRPAGSVPAVTEKEKGGVLAVPAAVRVWLYAWVFTPPGSVVGLSVIVGARLVSVKVALVTPGPLAVTL